MGFILAMSHIFTAVTSWSMLPVLGMLSCLQFTAVHTCSSHLPSLYPFLLETLFFMAALSMESYIKLILFK